MASCVKILIVESIVDAELVTRELNKEGLEFLSRRVETNKEFVEQIEELHPDVILAEDTLPAFDWLSALAFARDRCDGIPFIFIARTMREGKALETLKAGASDYFLKSDLAKLGHAVKRALREKEEHQKRHLADAKLNAAYLRYRLIVNAITDPIHVVDKNLRILITNPALKEWNSLLGLKTEVIGNTLNEVYPFLKKETLEEYGRVFSTGKILETEEMTFISNNKPYFTETKKIPVFEGGVVSQVVTILRDVSASKEVENHQKTTIAVLQEINRNETSEKSIRNILKIIKEYSKFGTIGISLMENDSLLLYENEDFYRLSGNRNIDCRAKPTDNSGREESQTCPGSKCMCHKILDRQEYYSLPMRTDEGIFWTNDLTETFENGEGCRDVQGCSWCRKKKFESLIIMPLLSGEKIIGLLTLGDQRRGMCTDELIHFLKGIASSLSIAISRDQLFNDLAQSKERFRQLAELLPETICEIDLNGKVTYLNRRGLKQFGYSAEDLNQGINAFNVIAKADSQRGIENFASLMKEQRVGLSEYQLLRKNGTTFPAVIHSSAIMHEGKPRGLRSCIIDISDLRNSQEKVQQIDAKYRRLFEDSRDPICIVRKDGYFIEFNQAALDLFDMTEEELKRTNIEDFYIDKSVRPELMIEIAEKGFIQDHEVHWRLKNNRELYCLLSTTLYLDPDGKMIGYQGFIRDVTEQRRIEAERYRLATAIDQVDESVLIADNEGKIQYVNPAFERLNGYLRQEVLGRHVRMMKSDQMPEDDYRDIWNTITEGNVWKGRFISKRKDGSSYETNSSISPVKDPSGNIVNYVSVKRDVSREDQLERQLRQAQKMEAIGTLAGGIAHDFNNILTAILGFAELVMDDLQEDSVARSNMTEVLKAGKRAKELIRQIVTFGRQETQELSAMQIQPIVKEAVKLLRSSIPTTIDIKLNAHSSDVIMADPTKIHQLVMNLCTNAFHAMQKNGGTLQVELSDVNMSPAILDKYPHINAERYVLLSVHDTGHGIDENIINKIFDPYFTTKKKNEGTGLGLAVVHGIVDEFRGFIDVTSEPGRGSTFDVYIPTCKEEQREEIDIAGEKPEGRGSILFVDDEEIITDLAIQMLERLGYEVTTKRSSVEALELFESSPDAFDLVITDMTMPKITGDKLSKEIRRLRPGIPIILCTGFSEQLREKHIKELDIQALFMKPLRWDQVAKTVHDLLFETSKEYSSIH